MSGDFIGQAEDETIQEDSNFLFSGGDSLQALHLCDDITTTVGVTSSGLLEAILDGSFSDVLYHVATETPTLQLEHSWTSHPVDKKHPADPVSSAQPKRPHTDPVSSAQPKIPHTDPAQTPLGVVIYSVKRDLRCTVVRRPEEVVEMGHSDPLRTIENSDSEGPIIRTRNTLTSEKREHRIQPLPDIWVQ
jgi:acyl-CoA synthetase